MKFETIWNTPTGRAPEPYVGYKAPKAGKYEKLMREAMARDNKNRREEAKAKKQTSGGQPKSRKPPAPKVGVWKTRCGKTIEKWQVQDIFISPNPKSVIAAAHKISIRSVTAIQQSRDAVSATRSLVIPSDIRARRAIENNEILTAQRKLAGAAIDAAMAAAKG